MAIPEYDDMDAIGLAEAVRKGDASPAELLDAAAERIQSRNGDLNAVVYDMLDRARSKVDSLPDGPLKGVPFLVKDLKLTIAGTPTSNSSKLSKDTLATVSSLTAERYEAAGLQILGKTNTPEFGIMGVTEPALRGPCRNPWNTGHTPGGSSGGSGSAVAARMVPIAHSGDGGGSIRIPASACGLFGLKPTRGRVTMSPHLGEAWGGFVQEHVLSRSVRDSALLLDIEAVPAPGEPYAQPPKERPWIEEVGVNPGKLRIGFFDENLYAGEAHPDCKAAVADAVTLCKELGHEVVPACPKFDTKSMVHAYFLTVATGVARFVETTSAGAGRKPTASDFEPATWLLAQIAWKTSAPDLLAAQQVMQAAGRDVAAYFGEYDVFLTSTLGKPPAAIGEVLPQGGELTQMALLRILNNGALMRIALDKMAEGKLAYSPNTQLFNQTGQPAMSVPLYWNAAGLPIGVQFAAGFGNEALLFRLASQLEEARPWAAKKPPGI
ncbi:MAG: amidase [Deltaproteobacteria bacterium]|nr:amidase [Deltaproteobacteria bacterium]